MRTTLVLNDELVAAAKTLAAARRCTLSAVVNEALRRALKPGSPPDAPTPFRLPTFRGEPQTVPLSPAAMAELTEPDDLAPFTTP